MSEANDSSSAGDADIEQRCTLAMSPANESSSAGDGDIEQRCTLAMSPANESSSGGDADIEQRCTLEMSGANESSSGRDVDIKQRRILVMKKIRKHYEAQKQNTLVPVKIRNIAIFGRARTGKSTVKNILVDPTKPPSESKTIFSVTTDPEFEAFYIQEENLVLNILDTPGLFEYRRKGVDSKKNETILTDIEAMLNLEITRFHLICFTVSLAFGIQDKDIEAIKTFIGRFGSELSESSCLIVTNAESKSDAQQKKLIEELQDIELFDGVLDYCKRGVFFTGSINYDDYDQGHESVYDQYLRILEYRKKLLFEFSKNENSVHINKSGISELRRLQESNTKEAENMKQEAEKQSRQHMETIKHMKQEMETIKRMKQEAEKRSRQHMESNNSLTEQLKQKDEELQKTFWKRFIGE